MTSRVRLGLVALAVVLVAQSVAHVVAVFALDSYTSVVDLNRNDGIPDVISTLAILAAAICAARLGAIDGSVDGWMLAGILGFVAAADVVHTGVESLGVVGVAVAIALLVVAALLGRIARTSSRQVATLLLAGVSCLVASVAIGFVFRLADRYMDMERGDVVYEAKIVVKQGLELAGWWFVVLGLVDAARRRVVRDGADGSRFGGHEGSIRVTVR